MATTIKSKSLKDGFNIAKIIKPSDGDFLLTFKQDGLYITSYDKRRFICARVELNSDFKECEEFLLPQDRSSLVEGDLDDVSLSVNDKGLSLKYHSSGVKKTATIKRRSLNNKRMPVRGVVESESPYSIQSDVLDKILTASSASALVKETKTEEDMRVNQIFFNSKNRCVFSNARFYATFVFHESISKDFSIISADIPIIRSFCDRARGMIRISDNDNSICFQHESTGNYLIINKLPSKSENKLSLPDTHECDFHLSCDMDKFKGAIKWAALTLEGTQRLTLSYQIEEKVVSFSQGDMILTSIPAESDCEKGFAIDLPLKVLTSICEYLFEGNLVCKFGIKNLPDMVSFEQLQGDLITNHFVRSMRGK